MRAGFLTLAVSILVATVACSARACSRSKPAITATPVPSNTQPSAVTSSTKPTSQMQLYEQIQQLGITPERAKLLFSLAIGPLPGVSVPDGARDPHDFCGTLAVGYLYQVWNDLTDAQRGKARELLATSPAARSSTSRSSAPLTFLQRLPFVTLRAASDDKPLFDYDALAQTANGIIGGHFKLNPLPLGRVSVDYGPPPPGTAYAETWSWDKLSGDKPWPDGCHIKVWDQKFAGLGGEDAASVMAHEVFHCYQHQQVGNAKDMVTVHRWIVEGEPTWIMAALHPTATVFQKDWQAYVFSPYRSYSDRGQDAIGVLGHLDDVTGGSGSAVWDHLLTLDAIGVGGNDAGPFSLLIQGNETPYYMSWGSSYFETPGNASWRMVSPASAPTSGPPPGQVNVAPGSVIHAAVGQYQAGLMQVDASADIVAVLLMTGYGRLHDNGFALETPLDSSGPLVLCMKQGGCRCPDGSPGASLITRPAVSPLSIGIDGGDVVGDLTLAGKSIDDFCKKPDQKSPSDPGGGGGGGGGGPDNSPPDEPRHDGGQAVYDTHVTTFDGLHYDFQAVGEYTLVRSTKDDFAIQTRQVPVLKSKTVTVNQAVATKIGDRRITVSLDNGTAVLRIDGTVTDAIPKLSGGSIVRSMTEYGLTYHLAWPDGTTARVEQMGAHVLNVKVQPSQARRSTLAGLLGDADGSAANDLIGSGGARLGTTPSSNDVTHSLADMWRITQATSLFDYQPGQSTASFTDPTFPDPNFDATKAPNRAAAEKSCREAGITDPHLLADCILDFAMTSDFLFTSSYSHMQQVMAARARIPSPASPGVLRTVIMAGTVTDPTSKPSMQFTGRSGDIIWVGQPECTDQYIEIGLVDPDGKGISGGSPCGLGRRTLPATGSYTFRAYRSTNPVGAYHVPIRFIRPDNRRAVSYGDVIAGRIETRAVHDVFTFAGHEGDIVRISGEGCDLNGLFTGLVDPAGHDSLGPVCRAGTDARLTKTGTYELVVNYDNGGPAVYHFVLQGASSNSIKSDVR